MFNLRLDFDAPVYLSLLGLLPLLWWISYRRLASLGPWRRWFALGFRSVVVIAIVAAVAGVQAVWVTERVTVLYLLDQSDSIPAEQRALMLDYAVENVRLHRDRAREDRVGVIVFGRDALIEVPPFADDLPQIRRLESLPERADSTDLQSALKLAQAIMPEDSRRRIVLISDGNETRGDAAATLSRLSEAGIGIDVMPVRLSQRSDVLVEKIDLPSEIRRGEQLEARVVLNRYGPADGPAVVKGRLRVTRRIAGEDQLLTDQPIELGPGKNVFPLRHQIDEAAAFTYVAKFVPDEPTDDVIAENNSATAYTYVRGKGGVLLIEPWDAAGGYQLLVDQLRQADIEVTVQPSNALFGSLAELQAYDAVILAGIARSSGESADTINSFTDEQIEMLVRNTQQLGCGLLMIGGPEALGAGGWAGTKLEEAMPVDFEIKNLKVAAVGALQLVLDTSGSMQGEKLTLCKAAAIEAVKALQPTDLIGVLAFDSEPREIIPLQRVGSRSHIIPRIAKIGVGGGTDLFPAMERGFVRLRSAQASTKHMIVVTDGQTPPNKFRELSARARDEGMTISGVAVGPDADVNLMRQIASLGGGKVYHVLSPRAIPKILMREARRVSRGLIHEDSAGIAPEITFPHVIIGGITAPPPINGFVMTTPKANPLVQNILVSPVPVGQENPLLSVWQYGLGRSAVLTTDAGQRWAARWTIWPGYDKFFEQLVRWLMRPSGDNGKFSIAMQSRDGEVQVVVHAIDQQDEFLNFLSMNASVLDPNMSRVALSMHQTAPGRYVGTFPADTAGNYFVNVVPQAGTAPLTAGVTVPYSDEYRLRALNETLLQSLVSMPPRGGLPGEMLTPLSSETEKIAAQVNPFRPGLVSDRTLRDIWPWVVLAACCLFVVDIFTRRVSLSFGWLSQGWAAIRGRKPEETVAIQRLDTLMAVKQSLQPVCDQATARYQPVPMRYESQTPSAQRNESADRMTADTIASGVLPERKANQPTPDNGRAEKPAETASYTQRLLDAKRAAQSKR